jgi:hypothetical protein
MVLCGHLNQIGIHQSGGLFLVARSLRLGLGIAACIIRHLQTGEHVKIAVHSKGNGIASALRPDGCGIRRPNRSQFLLRRLLVAQALIVGLI